MSEIYKEIFGTNSVEEFFGKKLLDSLYEGEPTYGDVDSIVEHIEALNYEVENNIEKLEADSTLQNECWCLYRGGIMLLSLAYNPILFAEGYEEYDSVPKLSQMLLNFFCEWGGSLKFLMETFESMQYIGIQIEKY